MNPALAVPSSVLSGLSLVAHSRPSVTRESFLASLTESFAGYELLTAWLGYWPSLVVLALVIALPCSKERARVADLAILVWAFQLVLSHYQLLSWGYAHEWLIEMLCALVALALIFGLSAGARLIGRPVVLAPAALLGVVTAVLDMAFALILVMRWPD